MRSPPLPRYKYDLAIWANGENNDQARHRDGPHRKHQHQESSSFAMLLEAQRRGYELHYMGWAICI